ncbi:MAG: hypothetical protein KAW17_06425 [Candidatus Eisenbacteria sp.]|nr:hypothetical protein [Candidatus Eisenbacteria bacterium]
MRWATICLLVVWFVVAGFSSWATADGPGWVPQEFKRGGGDELESCGRFDPAGGDGGMGLMPAAPTTVPDNGVEIRSSYEPRVSPFTWSDALWWVMFHLLWLW